MIRTYFPYTRINASTWGLHQSFNLTEIDFNKTDLFRKFDDLQGFPLKVTIFRRDPTALKSYEFPKAFRSSYLMRDAWRADEYSGVDGLMLANAAKSMNFTTVNVPQIGIDFGFKLSNGTFVGMNGWISFKVNWNSPCFAMITRFTLLQMRYVFFMNSKTYTNQTGSIGSVLHSKVIASFNGRFLTDYDTNDIDYMFPYYFDKLCVISPKALKIPGWMAIFKCFSITVWLSFLVVNCLCGFFWFMLKRSNINYL